MLLLDTTEPTSEPEEIISALRDVLAAMSPMRQLTSQEKRNFRKDLFEILESTLYVEPYWLDRPARRMGTLYEESSEVKFSFNRNTNTYYVNSLIGRGQWDLQVQGWGFGDPSQAR